MVVSGFPPNPLCSESAFCVLSRERQAFCEFLHHSEAPSTSSWYLRLFFPAVCHHLIFGVCLPFPAVATARSNLLWEEVDVLPHPRAHTVFQTRGQIRGSDTSLPGEHREGLGGEFPSFLPQMRHPSAPLMVQPLRVVPEGEGSGPGCACVGSSNMLLCPLCRWRCYCGLRPLTGSFPLVPGGTRTGLSSAVSPAVSECLAHGIPTSCAFFSSLKPWLSQCSSVDLRPGLGNLHGSTFREFAPSTSVCFEHQETLPTEQKYIFSERSCVFVATPVGHLPSTLHFPSWISFDLNLASGSCMYLLFPAGCQCENFLVSLDFD